MMPNEPTTILPRALLFDMDGTLTEPMLDFPLIKREMGIGDRPILEALGELDDASRASAEAVLLRHEQHAAACSRLNPGCQELLAWIRDAGLPIALITRNSAESVATLIERHGLHIDFIVTRTDAPPKPAPDALHAACTRLEVCESEAWMIGDGQYDVEAGIAAGIRTVWVSHDRRPRPFAAEPWRTVPDLHGVAELLRACRVPQQRTSARRV